MFMRMTSRCALNVWSRIFLKFWCFCETAETAVFLFGLSLCWPYLFVCLPVCLSAPPARLSVLQAAREESLCCSRDSNLIPRLRLCGASSVLHRILDQCPAKKMLLWFHVDCPVTAGKSSGRSVWAQTSFSGEMSAVSSEQTQAGEQNRTGAEPELQKAGVLEPQTVFVILDSSETLNLVRWVRKFWEVPLLQQRQTPFKNLSF